MTQPDLLIFDVLRKHGVPFVIIGGHAVNFHGFLRLTEDIDVVWLRSPENEAALAKALDELEAKYIGREIDPSTGIERLHAVSPSYIQAHPLMMLCTRAGFLDLFSYIPGLPEADVSELFKTSIEHEGLRFTSREWLTRMKQASGRSRDLEDLKNLPHA